ncbi:unnamed protein product [Pleuronectes platessa]|uniref:Uncharacterized protein n=1 Tax=Pleuronectes platessa TaxID=8262 RepID=A0A9N7TWZ4_PLEPL|nr:unnamed protein product [Pleuronectes platessa]
MSSLIKANELRPKLGDRRREKGTCDLPGFESVLTSLVKRYLFCQLSLLLHLCLDMKRSEQLTHDISQVASPGLPWHPSALCGPTLTLPSQVPKRLQWKP